MLIHVAVFLGGVAALSWELLWLHFAALAIGVSAQAAAIVLSALMLGIAAGSISAGGWLKHFSIRRGPVTLAMLELAIGICGLFLPVCFGIVEHLDRWAYHTSPAFAPLVQAAGIIAVIGVPSFFMGATVPVYARIATDNNGSIAALYATNTTGAAAGILAASFVFIPGVGITRTVYIAAGINAAAAFCAVLAIIFLRPTPQDDKDKPDVPQEPSHAFIPSLGIVFCTGLATFILEIAWFRSLRAALQATTESWALMLFVTLIALAAGGYIAGMLRRSGRVSLALVLAFVGFFVFEATPVIERMDLYVLGVTEHYDLFMLRRFIYVLIVLGPPMGIIGIVLPWILETHNQKRKVSLLYAVNTAGAVAGSLIAAWVLLPAIGFVRAAWTAGGILFVAAFVAVKGKERIAVVLIGLVGILIAVTRESGIGTMRVQGVPYFERYHVLDSREGPDATVSAIEDNRGVRHLFIDGFSASSESKATQYMEWMGRLPMMLHPDPQQALVICFGTGQTANGVRQENPGQVDIVDVNPAVFEVAAYFDKNQDVLQDPRSRAVVMDGRAYLRRVKKDFDVITLEPMPPTFAGSNALYSAEFYRLIYSRLRNNGVAAQWLPFHLVDEVQSASIIATFLEVFQDVVLWIDPDYNDGILLGFKRSEGVTLPLQWHGLQRNIPGRSLTDTQIRENFIFKTDVLQEFAKLGVVITDDNQYLSYGYGRLKWWGRFKTEYESRKYIFDIMMAIARKQVVP